jgi:trimeric autotransporter adhesin
MRFTLPARARGVLTALACISLLVSCGGGSMAPKKAASKTLTKIVIGTIQSLAAGTNLQLTASGTFSDGSEEDLTSSVTWEASPSAVATISTQGDLKGVAPGTAQVSAASQGITGQASITVGPPALMAISVSPSQGSLPLGESEPFAATGNFSDGSKQNLTSSVTWKASPSTIATINSQGNLASVSQGPAQVSATFEGITGNASITIGPAALLHIVINASQSSLPLGQSESLTATGNFSDGTSQNITQWVAWQVSPSTAARVDTHGNLTTLSAGAAQISAAYQGITGQTSIAVISSVLVGITVAPQQASLPLGDSEAFTAVGNFSDGTIKVLTSSVAWKVSPSTIATIDAQGNLTTLSQGSAQITAASQGITGKASIIVDAAALLQITVSPSQMSLPLGESQALSATGSYSDGTSKILTQSVRWHSSGPTTAGVSPAGIVATKALGTTTINATLGSMSGTAGVTVTPAVIVSLTITPATYSMIIGNSNQFQAIANYSDGTTQNMTSTVGWSAATPMILNVTNAGLVTGAQVGAGTLLARTSTGSFTASASVMIAPLMMVSYFDRANAASSGYDGTIRITNPGYVPGNLCAMVYVFDAKQEMNECCGCSVSDSGLLTLSLLNDLTANTLNGKPPVAGSIEIVPSEPGSNGQCNAGSLTPNGELLGWATNVQGSTGSYQVTEMPLALAPLGTSEEQVLASECSMIQQLGSGAGACTCGSGGN